MCRSKEQPQYGQDIIICRLRTSFMSETFLTFPQKHTVPSLGSRRFATASGQKQHGSKAGTHTEWRFTATLGQVLGCWSPLVLGVSPANAQPTSSFRNCSPAQASHSGLVQFSSSTSSCCPAACDHSMTSQVCPRAQAAVLDTSSH